jgi:hypothetical protein
VRNDFGYLDGPKIGAQFGTARLRSYFQISNIVSLINFESLHAQTMEGTVATVKIQVAEGYEPLIFKIYQSSNIEELIGSFVKKYKLSEQIHEYLRKRIQKELQSEGIALQ